MYGVLNIDWKFKGNENEVRVLNENYKILKSIVGSKKLYISTDLERKVLSKYLENINEENIINISNIDKEEEIINIVASSVNRKFNNSKILFFPSNIEIKNEVNIKKMILKFSKILDINGRARIHFAGKYKCKGVKNIIEVSRKSKLGENSSTFYNIECFNKEEKNVEGIGLFNYGVILAKSKILKGIESLSELGDAYVVPVTI